MELSKVAGGYFKAGYSAGRPSKGFWNVMQYIIMLLVIYQSGSIFLTEFYYKQSVIFIFSFMLILFIGRVQKLAYTGGFVPLLAAQILLCLSLLMTITLTGDTSFNTYVGIFLQVLIAGIAVLLIGYEHIKEIYVNIMFFFAATSLLFFAVQLVYPRIIYWFPMTPAVASTDYYNAYIYVYQKAIGYGANRLVLLNRNTSIFWEAGCYQAFLNIALLFVCNDLETGKNVSRAYLKIIIFIIAVVTTFSTTGFIVLLCILFAYRNTILKTKNKNVIPILIMLAGLLLFLFLAFQSRLLSNFFSGKLNREFSDFNYILSRISFEDLQYLFYEGKFNLFGISYSTYHGFAKTATNSILYLLACYGILYPVILLSMYYRFSRFAVKKSGWMMLIFIFIFSSEALLDRPFFLCLAAAGALYYKKGDTQNESSLALQHRAANGGQSYFKSRHEHRRVAYGAFRGFADTGKR